MLSKAVRCGVCLGLGVACVAVARGALAQEAESFAASMERPRNALQLSLQGSAVDYHRTSTKYDKLPNSSVDTPELKTSTTGYGFLGSGFGAGIGYAWDQVSFGVRGELTTATTTYPSSDGEPAPESSATVVRLMPRLEYMFDRGTTRPYIAGTLGVLHVASSSKTTVASPPSSSGSFSSQAESETSATDIVVGAAFGLHAFLNRSVSLDPEFAVSYASGSGTDKFSGSGSSSSSSQRDFSENRVQVLLTLGLSAWIDSAPTPIPPPPAPEEQSAPAAAAPEEQVEKPVSVDIHLPHHHRLYIQVSKDPARPSALVRLSESRNESVLATCEDIAIFESGGPIKLQVRSHGEHYVTGRLSIHALELLATTDATISVCATQWELGQESREAVATFLKERRDLLDVNGDSDLGAPATPPPAPAPALDPNAAPAPTGTTDPAGAGATPPAATPGAAPSAAPGIPSAPFPAAPGGKTAPAPGPVPAPQAPAKPKLK